jgi:hypothetical protein
MVFSFSFTLSRSNVAFTASYMKLPANKNSYEGKTLFFKSEKLLVTTLLRKLYSITKNNFLFRKVFTVLSLVFNVVVEASIFFVYCVI